MASFMGFFAAFFLLQLQVVISEENCAMYDVCGKRSDGVVLNCAYGSPSVEPDQLFSAQIQSLCPTLTGNVCCTELQFETLRRQLKQAIPYLVGCPACLRNYLNIFCELSCSPNQSLFINVNSVSKVSGNVIVDGIDYYITDTFGKGLYNSCKDVKFGPMRKQSIDFIGAGAENFEEWFDFLGEKAAPGLPGSPYAIDFKFTAPESSKMQLMNVSTYSCADTSLGCSCDNCPDVCSNSGKKMSSIRIWHIEVKFKSVIWALARDSIRLAEGIACLIGICIFWVVAAILHIILNFKFLMGLGIGYIFPVLGPLFRIG